MLKPLLAACMWLGPGTVPSDTVIVIGEAACDLTGDGQVEVITIIGTGRSLDSLAVRLTILTSGMDTLYVDDLAPITRRIGFDGPVRNRSATEQRLYVRGLETFYFANEKFKRVAEFTAMLERVGPGLLEDVEKLIARQQSGRSDRRLLSPENVWAEIRERNGIVFEYARGGDGVTAIAWSSGDQSFYRLLECC